MPDQQIKNIAQTSFNNLAEFERAIVQFRPKLHHYCARMTGSVIEGEDVLQTSLSKAFEALSPSLNIQSWEAWLFRIAHNTALDLFRTQKRQRELLQELTMSDEEPKLSNDLLTDNLQQLMVLPPLQRSVVVLRELYGYKSSEIATLLVSSPPAIKSALHRARSTLKKVSSLPNPHLHSSFDRQQVALLKQYTLLFNARAFDEIRDLLQREVKLDMVNKAKIKGRAEVGNYYTNYQTKNDWYMEPGLIEGQPAMLAFDRQHSQAQPMYFILLAFNQGELIRIRDFRYAQYVMKNTHWQRLDEI